ncbi:MULTISPECIES: class I SAM-dependent methyltransferase [Subtercola]|uniref:Class I SAM-dependent methyltransferase n=1 Tax=Subtercola vilae TaxID=2056433 RepID=A0A4T2BZZ8_9MICO|nr:MULTISPECIES: class I SAM-dependent methyltransferase [Subtercola]MEA9985546.1 class I SAM-dependent methyltransferase [Subtercola sp. RTI3]TIH36301.1 class I SAM-dependent methyltransferase [Subtercola vilae]
MTPTFGAGGGEPYARALANDGQLLLIPDGFGKHDAVVMDVSRWSAAADATDMSLIEEGTGPLLDIGCGPGRMVKAALTAGYVALGIDVSQAAIDVAEQAGIPVLKRSVFEPLPLEGEWMTLLLVDGNIGIGGDVSLMLERCAELLSPSGSVLVEVQTDPATDATFDCTVTLDDNSGAVSASFPWAQIGSSALETRARMTGLRVTQTWSRDGRTFCRLGHE